ncbi:MAG: hypoxanthine phosphoribosyltransferase [Proteobacteria bacterium]|nr:hypoxanthine phosphoribosyltransferase [Pseudomonadota bacterium]MBU1737465.1 hypoxanthine phosphoribosyltransferase [Pseudomonadota bacterium]
MTEKKIILDSGMIAARVGELGHEITRDYADGNLLLVGVLTGAFIFTADLARQIQLPLEISFIKIASYGEKTLSSGNIELVTDIETSVSGRDLLIVEDIVDTGNSLAWLKNHLALKNPRSLKFCSLIDKSERRTREVTIDYTGFALSRGFLVGYGLDYGGQYRQLPAVYELVDP